MPFGNNNTYPRQRWDDWAWDIKYFGSNGGRSSTIYDALDELLRADGKGVPIHVGPRGGLRYGRYQLTPTQFEKMKQNLEDHPHLRVRLVADVNTKKMRLLNTRLG